MSLRTNILRLRQMSQQMADYLCFTAEQDNSTIALTQYGSPDAISLEYSTNGSTWTAYSIGTTINLASGGKVYFRATSANSTFSTGANDYYKFSMEGQIAASGNIMSLLDKTMDEGVLTSYCFTKLFVDCTCLTSAPILPATTLVSRCYNYMFSGCISLTSAPILPATTLAYRCYNYMFYDCTNLNEVNVAFTSWVDNATTNWLNGASSSGTFTCPSGLAIQYGVDYIPEGWTVINND